MWPIVEIMARDAFVTFDNFIVKASYFVKNSQKIKMSALEEKYGKQDKIKKFIHNINIIIYIRFYFKYYNI